MAIDRETAERLAREADARIAAIKKMQDEILEEHMELCHSDGSECRDGCEG